MATESIKQKATNTNNPITTISTNRITNARNLSPKVEYGEKISLNNPIPMNIVAPLSSSFVVGCISQISIKDLKDTANLLENIKILNLFKSIAHCSLKVKFF
ncbi:MAG: hypothetical protein WCG60_02770 [bacterium]